MYPTAQKIKTWQSVNHKSLPDLMQTFQSTNPLLIQHLKQNLIINKSYIVTIEAKHANKSIIYCYCTWRKPANQSINSITVFEGKHARSIDQSYIIVTLNQNLPILGTVHSCTAVSQSVPGSSCSPVCTAIQPIYSGPNCCLVQLSSPSAPAPNCCPVYLSSQSIPGPNCCPVQRPNPSTGPNCCPVQRPNPSTGPNCCPVHLSSPSTWTQLLSCPSV